jgi:CHAT domain-containing protein
MVCCWRLLTVVGLAICAPSCVAQVRLAEDGPPVNLILHPNESRSVEVSGRPGSLRIVEVDLEGGLLLLHSAEAPPRILDLGRGAHFRYAVTIPADGLGKLQLASGEHRRDAALTLRPILSAISETQALQLHAAEVDFAVADSTRRHQAGAPDATEAMAKYDHAADEAEAAGDLSLMEWILDQKARFLLFQKSNYLAPYEILLRASALPSDGKPAIRALTYKTLSSCMYFMGHMEAAVVAAEHALDFYKQTGDVYWQDVVLGNLIADYSELGRTADAARAGREALTDAEQAQDTAGVVFCLTELANLYRRQGNPQAAFEAFREAEAWSKDILYAPLVQAEIEQSLGRFYIDMGLWREAQAQLERCLKQASPDSPAALEAKTLLAQALVHHGVTSRALQQYGSAIATTDRLGLVPEGVALRIERSAILLRFGRVPQARADAMAAQAKAGTLKNPGLQIDATLAAAAVEAHGCIRTHTCDEAEGLYQKAISLMHKTNEQEEEAIAYAGVAQIKAEAGDDAQALQLIEHALTLVENSRASFSSNVIAASYFDRWKSWYSLAEQVSLRLDRTDPAHGYRDTAFRYSERARARIMLDTIGESHQAGRSVSPELERALEQNEKKINADQSLLLKGGSDKVASELEELYHEQDELAASGASKGPKPLDEVSIANLSDVQRDLLGRRDALVAFALGPRQSFRWVITRDAVHVAALPGSAELTARLEPLHQAMTQQRPSAKPGEDAGQYAQRLAAIDSRRNKGLEAAGRLLLSNLPANVSRLYVVADGDLSSLPWNALRIPCPGRVCYAVQRFAIMVEPSASVATRLMQRTAPPGATRILLVSDTLPLSQQPGPRWDQLSPLPASRRESDQIARLAGPENATMLYGRRATVGNLKTALQERVTILHLGTHTLLVPDHPELSGIALSPDRAAGSNGILWLHDIPSLTAPPLVTLSGCSTEGASLDGEAMTTLTQVFFLAGAQSVVASGWSVDDDATAALMQEFYKNLLVRHMDAADSLRSAQLQGIFRHLDLSDWAAFIVNGVQPRSVPAESARK